MKLKVGDKIPNFVLQSQEDKSVKISDFQGRKPIVLYFYPKDNTPGCTTESCSFRDQYEDFKDLGAEVIGISSDSVKSHQGFAGQHRLPFILLSDAGGKVRRLFGVPSTLGLLAGRVTYVVDKNGIVRHIFSSQFNAKRHVKEALEILKKIGMTKNTHQS